MAVIARLGREQIDGRPLYQYRIDLELLAGLEVLINHPCSTDAQKILALAPVAAARFASNYDDGVPAWAHCGAEVERLYRTNQAKFRTLMELSLGRYGVPIVKRPDADLLLETIICQAGLPSGMLRQGRALRGVVDELMKRVAQGSDDPLGEASSLITAAVERGDGRQGTKLRKAYQEAGHLPQLCVDLVAAIIQLTQRANWAGGSLDALWEIPDWDIELPFRVDQAAARVIVSQLLDVAITATGGSGFAIERVLSVQNGEWTLRTRAAFPGEGVDLPAEDRDVVSVHYTVGQEPVSEAFRIRRKDGSRYTLARAVQDLPESAADRPVSLALQDAGGYTALDCAGGEPLDEDTPWVFESRTGEHVYRAPAPVRLRVSELMVAVPDGTEVFGDAIKTSRSLSLKGVARALWKVTGKARFTGKDGEPELVQAGYTGPQAYLDFRGRSPSFKVHGFSAVFLGNPAPRRIGGLSGRIEWRKVGSPTWNSAPIRAETGHLSFRLVDADGEVLAERRRVFVLPECFRPEVTNKSTSFKLPPSFEVRGRKPDPSGAYVLDFGQASRLEVVLSTAGSDIEITFERPTPAAFIDVATGEETSSGKRKISSRAADLIRAYSTLHDHVEIRRASDHWAAVYSVDLQNNKLNISELKAFREALSFHPRGRTHALTVQFQNGPAIEIEPYRIQRKDGRLTVPGADSDIRIQLRSLTPLGNGQPQTIDLDRIDTENWLLPETDGSLYLAIDTTYQAAPCLVASAAGDKGGEGTFLGAIAIGQESERERALIELYERIIENPHEGYASVELTTCLKWLGDFQFSLAWLDPFLVLSASPPLALRMLSLSRILGEVQAEQGLRWALDGVPFFWHRVTPGELEALMSWVGRLYGQRETEVVRSLMDEMAIPSRMRRPDVLRGVHRLWRDSWHTRVIEWGNSFDRGHELRGPALADTSNSLWKHLEGHVIGEQFLVRPKAMPETVSVFRTYLLAPYELALATALGIEMDRQLRDDLLFARHMIDPAQFDDAYCAGLALLENIR